MLWDAVCREPHVTERSNAAKSRNIKKEFNNNYLFIFYWLCVDKHVSQMMCPAEFFAVPCNFLLQPFEINRGKFERRSCLLKIVLIYIVSNSDCETAFSLIHMLSTQFKGYPQMLSFLLLTNLSQTDLLSLSFLAECVFVSYSTLPFSRNYSHPAGMSQNVLQTSKTTCTCSSSCPPACTPL